MALARCPQCAAAVPVGAPWCTLCFADLRPRPAVPPPTTVDLLDPVPAAVGSGAAAVGELDRPAPAPPGRHAAHRAEPTWPCSSCGRRVALAENACPTCRTPFLAAAEATEPELPLVGAVAGISRGRRAALMIGGALAVVVLFLLAAVVVG